MTIGSRVVTCGSEDNGITGAAKGPQRFPALADVNCMPVSKTIPLAKRERFFASGECVSCKRRALPRIATLIPFPEVSDHVTMRRVFTHSGFIHRC